MSVPVLVLMFAAMVAAAAASLSDLAAHAAAADLAELHANQAAAALTRSCLSDTGCAPPPGVDICTVPGGVSVTATVTFDTRLWTSLDAARARRVIAADTGTGADAALTARLAGVADAC